VNWLYSLRTRLIVLYSGLILAGFGGLALWAGQQIGTAAREDFERRAESEVAIVARALIDPVEHYLEGELQQSDIATMLDNYARQTNSNLTLINNQGKAWLTTTSNSDGTLYLNLPEIITARENRITHETRRDPNGELMIYTAAPLLEDGRIISIAQLIIPLDDVQAAIQRRWIALGLGIAGLGIVVMLVSILISASLTRPLARMQQAALQISAGDFSAHVPDHRRDEIGQVARTFNIMSRRVQAMLEEQRAFASNASHELRTPLTTVGLRVEALQSSTISADKQAQYLQDIEAEIRRMKNLVDDLILLSRFDAGSVELGRDMIDVPRFARQLIKEMQSQAEGRQIDMMLVADDTLPPVRANLTHLHVVFRNILDNAIKYMSDAGGEIRWQIQMEDGWLVSTITDTGKGIDADELAHVLERFYRADKSHSRLVPGAGLGLSLVQSIVDAYGGAFTLNSQGAGMGTIVTVMWPKKTDTPT
jgi:signal transduction histidine kinase